MIVGLDATPLTAARTGIGNYVHEILLRLVEDHPSTQFILFSNSAIHFESSPRIKHVVTHPFRRGAIWQNTQLRSALKYEAPDVFWATMGTCPPGLPRRLRVVATLYDLVHRFAPESVPIVSRWSRRIFQPVAARRADAVAVISRATGDDVRRHHGVTPAAVIVPPVKDIFKHQSAAACAAMRRAFELPDRYALVLGTLEPRKNLTAFIRCYIDVYDRGLPLPLLAIAGGRGWLDSTIESTLTAAETRGIVRRLGFVPDASLPPLYAACDAFFMPSVYEGFGMPLLEAQSCGAPVAHGGHAAMAEACGNLGAITGTMPFDIARALQAYATSALPLVCRLPSDIDNDVGKAAATMWNLLSGTNTKPKMEIDNAS